jgi:hypothetical protein
MSPRTPVTDDKYSKFLWLPPSQQNKYTFPSSVFLDESFSATDFVQEYRSRVDNLETLKQELKQFHHFLREETVSLIHRDYNSFIEFSSQLESIKDQVDQVKISLPQVKESLQQFSQLVDDISTQCSIQQNRVKNAQSKRSIAMYMLNLHTQLELLGKLLDERDFSCENDGDQEGLVSIALQLQHLRRQLDALQKPMNDTKLDEFMMQYEEKWATIDSHVQTILQDLLQQTKSESNILVYLEALAICNKQRDTELLLEEKWMKPIWDQLSLKSITDPRTQLYEPLLQKIEEKFGPLLRLSPQQPSFRFLINTVLPITCQQLQECKNLYEFRDRSKFHAQYLAQHDFFQELERRYVTNVTQLHEFRQVECIQNLTKRWQLKIYFTLLKQEIAKEFEAYTNNPTLTQLSDTTGGKSEQLSEQKYPLLDQCWKLLKTRMFDQNVFLYKLTHEFLSLYVQMLSRLQQWIRQTIDSTDNVELLASLLTQLESLRTSINNDMLSNIRDQLSASVLESCQTFIQETSNRLLLDPVIVLTPISDKIIKYYAVECSRPFEDIARKVSWTRSLHAGGAESHSPYITQILRPLIQFSTKYDTSLSNYMEQWVYKTIEIVAVNYFTVCKEWLTSARKTELSLQRLKRQASTNASIGGSSAILVQIQLDVKELSRLIQQNFLYVDLEQIHAFRQLLALQIEDEK